MQGSRVQINTTGDIGAHATVTQIYAPGQAGFEAELLLQATGLPAFSPEWLQFFQERVPLIAREAELAALQTFLDAPAPFLWWGVHGPAGIGKSRLAHELLVRSPQWEGGFLAADRSGAGAASAWQPQRNALWVVDYAAARGEALSETLVVLSRRFGKSPTKVRVLLLERSAGAEAGWWRSLTKKAGHQASLLRLNLHEEPLELAPLGDEAPRMLEAWLTAGGQESGEASRLTAGVTPSVLARATAGGRPLLVAMVAAALHRRAFQPGGRGMPEDFIDDYLSRELRLMSEQSSAGDFAQACITLFTATLTGGQPDLNSWLDRTPGPPDEEAVLTLQRGLRLLKSRGISERSEWALRPDALGERFIEVMAIRAPQVIDRYPTLPPYDAGFLGSAIWHVVSRGKAYGTLSRMPDESIRALLALALREKPTMRWLLITLKYLALYRGAPLSADYASLLKPELFGERFIPEVAAFVQAGFGYAAGQTPLEDLQAGLQGEKGADLAVWLIPFVASITSLEGRLLHRIVHWYSGLFQTARIGRARELILAANLLVQLGKGLISAFNDPQALESLKREWLPSSDTTEPARLLWSILSLYQAIEQRAEGTLAGGDVEDAKELAERMSLAAVQLSYALMSGWVKTEGELDREAWMGAARWIAVQGTTWSRRANSEEQFFLCIRNALAAGSTQDPDHEEMWDARWEQMRLYAKAGAKSPWMDLAVDAVRVASRGGRVAPVCRVVSEALACTAWSNDAIVALIDQGQSFDLLVDQLLAVGDWQGAVQCVRAYVELLRPDLLDEAAMPASLPGMMSSLAASALNARASALLEVVELLEGMFDLDNPRTPRSALAASCMATITSSFIAAGLPEPFRLLSFETIQGAADAPVHMLSALGVDASSSLPAVTLRATCPQLPDYSLDILVVSAEGHSPDADRSIPPETEGPV